MDDGAVGSKPLVDRIAVDNNILRRVNGRLCFKSGGIGRLNVGHDDGGGLTRMVRSVTERSGEGRRRRSSSTAEWDSESVCGRELVAVEAAVGLKDGIDKMDGRIVERGRRGADEKHSSAVTAL